MIVITGWNIRICMPPFVLHSTSIVIGDCPLFIASSPVRI
jgi:hypothetical protein